MVATMAKRKKRQKSHSKFELTPFKVRKGWKKVIRGKVYYFKLGECPNPDKGDGYLEALREYIDLKTKLDREEEERVEHEIRHGKLPNGSTVEGTIAYQNWGKIIGTDSATPRQQHQTIHGLVNAYLEERKLKADSGQIGISSYSSDKYRLATFLSFCNYHGKGELSEVLTPEFLGSYKATLLAAVAQGEQSEASVKHCLRTVKAMLMWAYDEELIEKVPRKMRDYANIKLPKPKPVFWTVDEVKKLRHVADARQELYILLGLNCGYTQADIASLTHEMIDWKTGIIKRDRNKTQQPQEHKLWRETLELLKSEATDPRESDLTLRAPSGQPLLTDHVSPQGNPTRTDSVRQAFHTLKNKAKVKNARTFKHFRKTGADMIAKQYQDSPWLVDLYLAHSEQAMKKHYSNQHFDKLHEATDWLAGVFGCKTL